MADAQPNTGIYFSRPYESDYARYRHFLIVNYGISIQLLRKSTKKNNRIDLSGYYQDKIIYGANFTGHTRQCPACAYGLYHTNLYNLEWLLTCPFHNIAFTTHCPECDTPWPSRSELPSRKCRTCGIAPLDRINESDLLESNDNNFQFIGALYQSLNEIDARNLHIFQQRHTISNWRSFPRDDLRYPQLIAQITNAPNKLSTMVHKGKNIHHKTFYNGVTDKPPDIPKEIMLNDLRNKHREPESLYLDFLTAKKIVTWITKQQQCPHCLSIKNYTYQTFEDFDRPIRPCVYCMSFSIWIFYLATQVNYIDKTIDADCYPFCNEMGIVEFYFPSIEYFTAIKEKERCFNQQVSQWMYSRDLESSFLKIVHLVNTMLNIVDASKVTQGYDYSSIYEFQENFRSSIDYYNFYRKDDELHILYGHENLIEENLSVFYKARSSECQMYDQIYQKHVPNGYYYELDISSLNFYSFMKAIKSIQQYTKQLMRHYCRGHEPHY